MITAGIAGLGKWGRILVDSVQGSSDHIRFTAGCTGRKARARDYCAETGIDLRDGLEDLLADDTLEAVVLATPHSQHAEQIAAVAGAGKHVFVEKPFTLDRASAEAAVAACAAAGRVCALGHNRRFLPATRRLKEMVTGGELGTILHVEANVSGPSALGYTDDFWRASAAESPSGSMTALGVHMVDALINLLGPIGEVRATSERRVAPVPIEDTTFMTLRFESGATGYVGTLFATARVWRLQVYGDKGWAEMDGQNRLRVKNLEGEEQILDFEPFDMERAELEAFAAACGGGESYPIPPAEAVHGTAVLEAVGRSAETGSPVSL